MYDKFIAITGTTLLVVGCVAIFTVGNSEFSIAITISSIAAVVVTLVSFLLFVVYDEERIQAKKDAEADIIKKKRATRIKKAKEQKIRKQKRKIKLEKEEEEAYKKGRPSRTAKAAKLLDMMEATKRRRQ